MLSDQIKKGVERAPNRSLLYALGLTQEELSRPCHREQRSQDDHEQRPGDRGTRR